MGQTTVKRGLLLLLQGAIVGFGAIMPGVSGGTLCVAFGMYKPLIEVLSNPRGTLGKYWKMLGVFLLGAGIGFVGLSGFASWLMEKNSQAVTCAFIGFILGTVPSLWGDAGKQGRQRSSYVALAVGFLAMLGLLLFIRNQSAVTIAPGLWGFLLCGILWGVSFVVPGLSSSTLLLFFGLYQPMLDGIASLSPGVLLPLAAGVGLCLLLLPKGVDAAFKKYDSILSHGILGVVAATTVVILPPLPGGVGEGVLYLLCVAGGAAATFWIGKACSQLEHQSN